MHVKESGQDPTTGIGVNEIRKVVANYLLRGGGTCIGLIITALGLPICCCYDVYTHTLCKKMFGTDFLTISSVVWIVSPKNISITKNCDMMMSLLNNLLISL